MKVIGYSDELSVFPGDDLNFHVSCDDDRYHAHVVRLVHGDTNPDGPGFKVEEVPTGVDTDYPGRVQPIHAGSHVLVDDDDRLHLPAPFSIQVLVNPTTPEKGGQGLVTRWDAGRDAGYGLFIGEHGCLELRVGDGEGGIQKLSSASRCSQGCGTWRPPPSTPTAG